MNAMLTKVLTACRAHSPVIAAITATVGFGVAVYMVAKKSPKTPILMQNAEQKKGAPLNKKEKTWVYAKAYAVPAAIFATSATLSIWSSVAATKKISAVEKSLAASTALYSAAQAKLANYEAKVEESIGKEAKKKIDDAMTEDRKKSVPATPAEAEGFRASIPNTKKCIWTEAWTGVQVYASYAEVLHNITILNGIINKEGSASITDFLDLFEHPMVAKYPKSADSFAWYKGDELILVEGADSDTMAQTGDPAFIINWNIDPVSTDTCNGVS